MATADCNLFLNSISGRVGNTVVFRHLRGKTIVAKRPQPSQKQSARQKANRNKFKEASAFAKAAMKDPAKKEYYWKKARKLKLPNAYTAAITDYMRSPALCLKNNSPEGVLVAVCKKDFAIRKIEVLQKNNQSTNTSGSISKINDDLWKVSFHHHEMIRVEDNAGNIWTYTADLALISFQWQKCYCN